MNSPISWQCTKLPIADKKKGQHVIRTNFLAADRWRSADLKNSNLRPDDIQSPCAHTTSGQPWILLHGRLNHSHRFFISARVVLGATDRGHYTLRTAYTHTKANHYYMTTSTRNHHFWMSTAGGLGIGWRQYRRQTIVQQAAHYYTVVFVAYGQV